MQYTIENGDTTRIYEVIYDKAKLEELLNKIVRECSYKVKGKFTLKASEVKFGYNKNLLYGISGLPSLFNGDPMYQDIIKVDDDFDGLSIENIFIDGTKVMAPKLASIVVSLLKGDVNTIKLLLEYADDDELKPINDIIVSKIEELTKIRNDIDEKVNRLIEISIQLKELGERKKEKHYFDVNLLNKYYNKVIDSIDFKLISEIRKQSGHVRKLSVKDVFDKKN